MGGHLELAINIRFPMKKTLYEVSIIRPIVIFLLVVLHAFTQLNYHSGNAINTNVIWGGVIINKLRFIIGC